MDMASSIPVFWIIICLIGLTVEAQSDYRGLLIFHLRFRCDLKKRQSRLGSVDLS